MGKHRKTICYQELSSPFIVGTFFKEAKLPSGSSIEIRVSTEVLPNVNLRYGMKIRITNGHLFAYYQVIRIEDSDTFLLSQSDYPEICLEVCAGTPVFLV